MIRPVSLKLPGGQATGPGRRPNFYVPEQIDFLCLDQERV
jgi:hypothetical protein